MIETEFLYAVTYEEANNRHVLADATQSDSVVRFYNKQVEFSRKRVRASGTDVQGLITNSAKATTAGIEAPSKILKRLVNNLPNVKQVRHKK